VKLLFTVLTHCGDNHPAYSKESPKGLCCREVSLFLSRINKMDVAWQHHAGAAWQIARSAKAVREPTACMLLICSFDRSIRVGLCACSYSDKIGRLIRCQRFESQHSDLMVNSCGDRQPIKIHQYWRDVISFRLFRLLVTIRARVLCTCCNLAKLHSDVL
jgi:hypothetical protein